MLDAGALPVRLKPTDVALNQSLVLALFLAGLGLAGLWRTHRFYGHLLHGWDAQFYYAQARSILFDRDLDVTNDMYGLPQKSPFQPGPGGYLSAPPRRFDGGIINKYPIGLSLVEAPMIGLGYLLRLAWEVGTRSESADPPGYGSIEVATTAIGLLLASVLGLVLLQRLAARRTRDLWAALAAVAAWFGTSLYYYSAVSPFMAHGVAFTLVVLAVLLSLRLAERPASRLSDFLALAVVVGLLFLVRYQQVLLLIVIGPWVVRGLMTYRGRRWLLAVPVAVFGALCWLQVVHNHEQTGRWVLTAYSTVDGKLFDWTSPDFRLALFSSSGGLLWISPIVLVAAAGCLLGPATRLGLGPALLAYGVLQVYVIASSMWPVQGDSFGARYWTECSPMVAVGLASLASAAGPRGRRLLTLLGAGLLSWTGLMMLLFVNGTLVVGMTHAQVLRGIFDMLRR